MEQDALMKALVQLKRMGNLLNEVLDLSQQLAEALDRNDQVSVEMLVAMRQEPIDKLEETDQALRDQLAALPPETGRRLTALLNGDSPAEAHEKLLTDQIAANRRRLSQIIERDKILNQKLSRGKSAYS